MGELSGGPLFALDARHRDAVPRLVQWDAWGNRVDAIEITPVWVEAARIAAERGVVATAYERKHGELSRIHQFALAYLFDGSTQVYTCPLAMTDGAARTLVVHGHRELVERAVTRLTSRDPARAWTSGQWMTERTGGSDVGLTETIARKDGDQWRLYGTKWFTSATTSQMALTLARPEGGPPGGHGLALFYVELRDERGRLVNIQVNRLKDKLGTRQVPTAELTLDGAPAIPVNGLTGGVKNITPMLNVTRTWNSVGACCGMRRGLALALDYAGKRSAFGARLAEKPLHVDTLAGLLAEQEGALLMTFRLVELLGREEGGTITEEEGQLLRLLTPIVKATTGKQAVAAASEILESFRGRGVRRGHGAPAHPPATRRCSPSGRARRTCSQLRTCSRAVQKAGGIAPLEREVSRRVEQAHDASMAEAGMKAMAAVAHAREWLVAAMSKGLPEVEGGARRFPSSRCQGGRSSSRSWSTRRRGRRSAETAGPPRPRGASRARGWTSWSTSTGSRTLERSWAPSAPPVQPRPDSPAATSPRSSTAARAYRPGPSRKASVPGSRSAQ